MGKKREMEAVRVTGIREREVKGKKKQKEKEMEWIITDLCDNNGAISRVLSQRSYV